MRPNITSELDRSTFPSLRAIGAEETLRQLRLQQFRGAEESRHVLEARAAGGGIPPAAEAVALAEELVALTRPGMLTGWSSSHLRFVMLTQTFESVATGSESVGSSARHRSRNWSSARACAITTPCLCFRDSMALAFTTLE